MQKYVRCQCESDTCHDRASLISADDAAAILCLDLSDSPLSQGDLMIFQQFHRRIHSLEIYIKNFECLFKAKDIMIRNVRKELVLKLWKLKDEVFEFFNAVWMLDVSLGNLETAASSKTTTFAPMEDLNTTVVVVVVVVSPQNQRRHYCSHFRGQRASGDSQFLSSTP